MTIEQRKDYDSEFCGSIPLNFINLIQPHGILVVLEKETLKIVQLSENFETITGGQLNDVLKKPLEDFVDSDHLEEIQDKVSRWNVTDKIPANLRFKMGSKIIDFTAVVHFKEEYVLMELEEKQNDREGKHSFEQVYQEVKYIMAALKEGKDIAEIGKIATSEIRKLSGFDRVLLYKFDENWNGSVISESKIEKMESYMGLRFPASDIPKQARDLYFRNPFRLIPNRDYVPGRLVPVINPVTNSFTDLSECNLRSVPKVHIEYLTNMGIKASMSTPIIINNKLWGLISCHNLEPRYLNFEMRSAFELLSNVISAQIDAREREQFLSNKSITHRINLKLLEQIYGENDFIKGLTEGDVTILDLLHATGVAIFCDKRIYRIGQTPSESQIEEIVNWLQRYNNEKIFLTDSLPRLFDKAIKCKDVCSGLMAIDIGAEKDKYILCFKGELVQTVSWGGDPNQAINFDPGSKNYHPRNSFSTWQETVKYTSTPWHETELEGAGILRMAVLEKILRGQ